MTGRRPRLSVMTTDRAGADREPPLSEGQVARVRSILAEAASDPPTVADVEAAIQVVLDLDLRHRR